MNQFFQDEIGVFGSAVRGKAHELVLTRVYFETAEIGECGIKKTKGVREVKFAQDGDFVACAPAIAGGGPFAYAINRQKCSLRKWRRKKSGGRVRLMVFRKEDARFESEFPL